jgi:hypothetical protein
LFYVFPIHGNVPMVGETFPNPKADRTQMMVGSSSFNARGGDYVCRAPLNDDILPSCVAVIARNRILAVVPLDESQLFGSKGDHEVSDLVIEAGSLPPEGVDPTHVALVVRVVDAVTKEPLDEALTISYLNRVDGRGSSMLNNLGAQREPQIIQPGSCGIVARCRGYVPAWTAGEFTPRAEPYVVTLELRRAVRAARGIVVDADQRPVANAHVFWFSGDEAPTHVSAIEPVTTDAEGRFEFEAVDAARGRIAVEADGYVPTFVDVAAGNDDTTSSVEMKRGVPVTFTCAPTADGNTPGGNLRIVNDEGALVREDWSAPFTRSATKWPKALTLAPGKYRYHVDFLSRADDEGEFVATDGAQVVVTPRAR